MVYVSNWMICPWPSVIRLMPARMSRKPLKKEPMRIIMIQMAITWRKLKWRTWLTMLKSKVSVSFRPSIALVTWMLSCMLWRSWAFKIQTLTTLARNLHGQLTWIIRQLLILPRLWLTSMQAILQGRRTFSILVWMSMPMMQPMLRDGRFCRQTSTIQEKVIQKRATKNSSLMPMT